jgi:hypothetical protein
VEPQTQEPVDDDDEVFPNPLCRSGKEVIQDRPGVGFHREETASSEPQPGSQFCHSTVVRDEFTMSPSTDRYTPPVQMVIPKDDRFEHQRQIQIQLQNTKIGEPIDSRAPLVFTASPSPEADDEPEDAKGLPRWLPNNDALDAVRSIQRDLSVPTPAKPKISRQPMGISSKDRLAWKSQDCFHRTIPQICKMVSAAEMDQIQKIRKATAKDTRESFFGPAPEDYPPPASSFPSSLLCDSDDDEDDGDEDLIPHSDGPVFSSSDASSTPSPSPSPTIQKMVSTPPEPEKPYFLASPNRRAPPESKAERAAREQREEEARFQKAIKRRWARHTGYKHSDPKKKGH